MFKVISRIPLVIDRMRLLCQCTSDIKTSRQSAGKKLNLGGGSANSGSRLYNFSVIGKYLVSDPSEVHQESMFWYVAHVDDVGLLAYSSAQFVHTNIPLSELFKFLPVLPGRLHLSIVFLQDRAAIKMSY